MDFGNVYLCVNSAPLFSAVKKKSPFRMFSGKTITSPSNKINPLLPNENAGDGPLPQYAMRIP